MESRDNHTSGHVKTQLEPEYSECAWVLIISLVKYLHYFRCPSSLLIFGQWKVFKAFWEVFFLLLMHSKHFTFIPHKLSDSHLITAEYNDLYEVKSWRTFMVVTWRNLMFVIETKCSLQLNGHYTFKLLRRWLSILFIYFICDWC